MKIFCIIPAWNEAINIVEVINSVRPYVDEVVVVDDCSTDNTMALALQTKATVLHHIINRHQGAALRTGTNYAIENSQSEEDIIIHFDADRQMRAEDIPTVIEPLKNNQADISLGSRFLNDNGTNNETKMPWFKKHIIMNLARLANRLLLGVRLTDPQSGFRAMTTKTAKGLQWQDGMSHASEILAMASKYNYRMTEVPITVIYHHFGQRLSGGFKIIKDILIGKIIK